MAYFALISRKRGSADAFVLEFGDRDRETVVAEGRDMRDADKRLGVAYDYRLIRTKSAHGRDVNAAIAAYSARQERIDIADAAVRAVKAQLALDLAAIDAKLAASDAVPSDFVPDRGLCPNPPHLRWPAPAALPEAPASFLAVGRHAVAGDVCSNRILFGEDK